jgi:hypothetical protein
MAGLTDFDIQKLSRFFKILINIDKRMKNEIPDIIKQVGFDFEWDEEKV